MSSGIRSVVLTVYEALRRTGCAGFIQYLFGELYASLLRPENFTPKPPARRSSRCCCSRVLSMDSVGISRTRGLSRFRTESGEETNERHDELGRQRQSSVSQEAPREILESPRGDQLFDRRVLRRSRVDTRVSRSTMEISRDSSTRPSICHAAADMTLFE